MGRCSSACSAQPPLLLVLAAPADGQFSWAPPVPLGEDAPFGGGEVMATATGETVAAYTVQDANGTSHLMPRG